MNEDWDEEDMPLEKAKETVNKLLSFSVLQDWDYRKSINYFLRHQSDYTNLFKLSKFHRDREWKPLMFTLLGFDGKIILHKYDKTEDKKELEKTARILEAESHVSVDEILGLLQIKKDERNQLASFIDQFDFSDFEELYNENLVAEIDDSLQVLHSQKYSLTSEIHKINLSIDEELVTVDVNKLKKLFDEVHIIFPNEVIEDFQKLISFNKEITDERKEILRTTRAENETELNKINQKINVLNSDRVEKLHYLTEYDSYKKFKKHQKELSQLEASILSLEEKLKALTQSAEIYEQISDLKEQIQRDIKCIHGEIEEQRHRNIRKIFNAILKEILNTHAVLSIKQNKEGNVEFNANIQRPDDLTITEEEFGTSYKKLMCIAFDLSLLENYSSESFFRFAYHDGVLEGLDNRKKIKFLQKSRSICKNYNFQHIITLIDTDNPRKTTDDSDDQIEFEKDEIILELNDKNEKGLLFEKYF